jgi:hypothetical protein
VYGIELRTHRRNRRVIVNETPGTKRAQGIVGIEVGMVHVVSPRLCDHPRRRHRNFAAQGSPQVQAMRVAVDMLGDWYVELESGFVVLEE